MSKPCEHELTTSQAHRMAHCSKCHWFGFLQDDGWIRWDHAYAGLTVPEVADLRERGFSGKFPELTDAENNVIFRARVKGYGSCFPCFPTAEAQARSTLAGAAKWLERE